MLGLVRLQIADAAAFLAAGAADHLMQQLERALGGARIARAEAQIGIDHADQIELGKVVPLGDKLRADDDIDAALLDRRGIPRACARSRRSRSLESTRMRGSGNSAATSSSSRSTPGPQATNDLRRLAFRAGGRRRRGEAAVVADELALEAVIDQPGVAVRAVEAEAAGAAERERRIAAAIEKQQRLLAALQRGLHRCRRAAAR